MTILDINIVLELYDKEAFDSCVAIFNSYHLDKPVFITEDTDSFQFRLNSDYEQFELKAEIAALFKGYHFSENPGNGTREIKLVFHTTQLPGSSDGWGRTWNEDSIHKSYYLIKDRSIDEEYAIEQKFRVLSDKELKDYDVHIAYGTNKDTGKRFFVVLKEEFTDPSKVVYLSDRRFATHEEAFWEGFRILEDSITEEYLNKKAKEKRKRKK